MSKESFPKDAESRTKRAKIRTALRKVVGVAATTAVVMTGVAVANKYTNPNNELAAQQAATAEELAKLRERVTTMEERAKRLQGISADLAGVSPEILTGEGLVQFYKLRGYNNEPVGLDLKNKITRATVQLGIRQKGETQWQPWCTGTKVSSEATAFVLTAAHCVKDGLAVPQKGPVFAPSAVNITSQTSEEFAILDPLTPAEVRPMLPIATVTSVAVDLSGETDVALLGVTPDPQQGVFFEEKPSFDLGDVSTANDVRVGAPGQLTLTYSLPQAAQGTVVGAAGVYLGRINTARSNADTFDVVGIAPDEAGTDACNYGGSGSQAILPNGHTTGPLAYRNNIGYPYDRRQGQDGSPSDGRLERLKLEAALGVNLDPFSTLCLYSVPAADTLGNLQAAVQDPTQVFYPPTK